MGPVGWENMTDDDTSMVLDAIQATRRAYWQMGFDIFAMCSTRRCPQAVHHRVSEKRQVVVERHID